MLIPSKRLGDWAQGIVQDCSASLHDRIERGIAFRNLYLTGDTDGDAQIYNKCFSHIESLASNLYSPVELRFNVGYYGFSSPLFKSMAYAATNELHSQIRSSSCDIKISEAVTWSLVKGKTFVKLLWGKDGFEPYLIQPEMMGMLREDITELDKQEAFYQSTYYTPDAFRRFLSNNPDGEEIFKKVGKYHASKTNSPAKDSQNSFKRIILSGIYPVGSSDAASASGGSRNIVDWMSSPAPAFSAKILESLIRLDEIWVRDDEREDWTTIQVVGDVPVEGKNRHRNIFAEALDPDDSVKKRKSYEGNPLAGHHPYIEFCANPIDSYAWGRSEMCNIALMQEAISKRINGIGALLRRQEDPNFLFTGIQGSAKDIMAKIKKPGGHLVDNGPSAKMQPITPELPKGLTETLNEYLSWFQDVSGFQSVTQGKGESGVRSQGHAETLVRMASPRMKDGALLIERQVEAFGGLALDILQAKVGKELTAWVMPKDSLKSKLAALFTKFSEEEFDDPPVPGMKPVKFLLHQLPEEMKVMVDSHSSSPAFMQDTRALMLELFKAGAMSPEKLVELTSPPHKDDLIEDLKTKEIEQAEFAQAHPELAAEQASKASKKKK